MKIIHIIYSLSPGGAERFVTDLCNTLSKDHEVILIIICDFQLNRNSFYKDEILDNVKIVNVGARRGGSLKSFISVWRIIRRLKPDIVHSHLNVLIYVFLPALFYHQKIKYCHTLHSMAKQASGYFGQKLINSWFFKKGWIQAINISENSKISFREYYGFDNSVLIHNGRIPLRKTSEFDRIKSEVSGLSKGKDHIFIHVARYARAKNQQMLIDVFNRLIKENRSVVLLVLGSYFDKGEGQVLVKTSLPGIHYLGDKSNVVDYLHCSDAFCLSSLWEGLPISLLEALSCGVVPICTPAGGIDNIVKDGEIGYISEGFDKESYYQTIIRYLGSKSRIKPQTLIEYFESRFSIDECAKNHLLLYEELKHFRNN